LQRVPDSVEDAGPVVPKLVVPDAEDAKVLRSQPRVALDVANRSGVLTAIKLDYQPGLETDKIDDVAPDGNLAAKLESSEAPIAKDRPENSLFVGSTGSQLPRECALPLGHLAMTWNLRRPLIRPAGTFSRKGRRRTVDVRRLWGHLRSRTHRLHRLLPLREKVAAAG
jgi:hypothetical protein